MTLNTKHSTVNRINWIDFAKGLTLIITVIGHSIREGIVSSVIYSFHMPLFFILSCITFHYSSTFNEYKKNVLKAIRRLLIPTLAIYGILTLWNCICYPEMFTSSFFWQEKLETLLFASAIPFEINGNYIYSIGMLWFFFALFVGRTLFDGVQLIFKTNLKILIASCVIGILGIVAGYFQWLPFSGDIALAIFPFLFFGYYLKKSKINIYSVKHGLIFFLVWLITFSIPFLYKGYYLNLCFRKYYFFPLCYIAAIAGTLFICNLSNWLCKLETLSKPVLFLGKHSMLFISIHSLDSIYNRFWIDAPLKPLVRLVLDILLMLLILLCMNLIKSIRAKLNSK